MLRIFSNIEVYYVKELKCGELCRWSAVSPYWLECGLFECVCSLNVVACACCSLVQLWHLDLDVAHATWTGAAVAARLARACQVRPRVAQLRFRGPQVLLNLCKNHTSPGQLVDTHLTVRILFITLS